MSEILLTQEVGSLAKPDWRVNAIAGNEITRDQIHTAATWADRLDLDPIETEDILCQARHQIRTVGELDPDYKSSIKLLAARFAVRLQEKAGLDILYDGEQDRSEMYQHAIERTNGFEWRGRVRAFDNKSYKKAACIDNPAITKPWHQSEVDRLATLTDRRIKVPITGAYTLAAWSYDEHFSNREDFVNDLATNVIRPNVQALLDQGVEWIQIDEPAATTVPSEVPLFIESFNRSVAGLVGKFSVHICFSDYSLLFPHAEALENCSQFSLEFANRDVHTLGTDRAERPAYQILESIQKHCPDTSVGLGVTTVHENDIESPELVRDRILYAIDAIGNPAKVYPSPDCGLRTRSWDVAYDKLARTVEGTQLAKERLQ